MCKCANTEHSLTLCARLHATTSPPHSFHFPDKQTFAKSNQSSSKLLHTEKTWHMSDKKIFPRIYSRVYLITFCTSSTSRQRCGPKQSDTWYGNIFSLSWKFWNIWKMCVIFSFQYYTTLRTRFEKPCKSLNHSFAKSTIGFSWLSMHWLHFYSN